MCLSLRVWACIVWLFMTLGAACLVAAITTPFWRGNDDTHEGLWTQCEMQNKCNTLKISGEMSMFDLLLNGAIHLESNGKLLRVV